MWSSFVHCVFVTFWDEDDAGERYAEEHRHADFLGNLFGSFTMIE